MSAIKPVELERLASAERVIKGFVSQFNHNATELRYQLLEAASACLGGFELAGFQKAFGIEPLVPKATLHEAAFELVAEIKRIAIHPAFVLSILSREQLDESNQRTTGAYHTDSRLATKLAQLASGGLKMGAKVIDPACGAGVLLVACALQAREVNKVDLKRWLAESVYAADLSVLALRGALLALASLTDSVESLRLMRAKWVVQDSLMAPEAYWRKLAPKGFDVVVGNPPWEKVKITRHEYLKEQGQERHYGQGVLFDELDLKGFAEKKAGLTTYSKKLKDSFDSLFSNETDVYVAFTALFERICKPGGLLVALVPAGLIRSQGTEHIRRHLFRVSKRVQISVIDNKARFFGIDTRFKFLAICCEKSSTTAKKHALISLLHEKGTEQGLEATGSVQIPHFTLALVRPDLSLPEVRTEQEWAVFQRMATTGTAWSTPEWGWQAKFCREVDMTREKPKFKSTKVRNALPVIEGRMVQQHRLGAKGHVSGEGRRAQWELFPVGGSMISPQFYIDQEDIPPTSRLRISELRGGFCDITGQTNERTMMAALIPAGLVCGNKVPTVIFDADPSEERLLAWAAIMNSLPFDWMLRRIVTTTVNYFLLVSLPMPKIAKSSDAWKSIVEAARELRELDTSGPTLENSQRVAHLRAVIDVEIAAAYGLSFDDLLTITNDFPLMDRGQPALPNEKRSTITSDLVLTRAAKRLVAESGPWQERARLALGLGARAYIPSEFSAASVSLEPEPIHAY